jgi:hypothetical protein
MPKFTLKWRGTSYFVRVEAESLAQAKLKMAKSEGVNPLMMIDRIAQVKGLIEDIYIRKFI